MNQLAALCVRRPVFATVLILVLVVFGVFGYTKLGLDRFPKVDFPIITVTTREPGSAPEDIETQITDKIEEAVNTINGIEELRSVSSEGISQVFIQFKLEKDGDVAAGRPRQSERRLARPAQGHPAADRRKARSRRNADLVNRGVGPAADHDSRHHRVLRQGFAASWRRSAAWARRCWSAARPGKLTCNSIR